MRVPLDINLFLNNDIKLHRIKNKSNRYLKMPLFLHDVPCLSMQI